MTRFASAQLVGALLQCLSPVFAWSTTNDCARAKTRSAIIPVCLRQRHCCWVDLQRCCQANYRNTRFAQCNVETHSRGWMRAPALWLVEAFAGACLVAREIVHLIENKGRSAVPFARALCSPPGERQSKGWAPPLAWSRSHQSAHSHMLAQAAAVSNRSCSLRRSRSSQRTRTNWEIINNNNKKNIRAAQNSLCPLRLARRALEGRRPQPLQSLRDFCFDGFKNCPFSLTGLAPFYL